MASDPDLRFWRHAYPHVRASRHAWSEKERERTILTLYDAEPAIRQHYATSNAENPAFFALFPHEPYTEQDLILARSHLCYQDQIDSLPQVWPIRPIARPLGYNRETQTDAAMVNQNGTPYEHWPPLPWADEPNLLDIGAGQVTLPKQDAFMDTKPYLADDETQWHGAK